MSDQFPVRIYLCGQLAIEHGAAVVYEADLPARQGRCAWAYLALNRKQPVSRDDLAEAIWGDEIPEGWDATINAVVSRLRNILRRVSVPDSAVSIYGEVGRYRLRLPRDAVVDWERARSAIHATDTLMRRRDYDAALPEARVATEIAGRSFLVGEQGPWIEGQRRMMADVHLHARECTVEAELGRRNPDIAEVEARALIQADPLRESSYRLLMRALAATGNRAQILRVMTDCRATLRAQVDIAPSDETDRLFYTLTGS